MSTSIIPFAIYSDMSDTILFTFNEELRCAFNFESDEFRKGYPDTYRLALEMVIKAKYEEMYALMGSEVRISHRQTIILGKMDLRTTARKYNVVDISKELRERFDFFGLS